jgi:hypothetical protein
VGIYNVRQSASSRFRLIEAVRVRCTVPGTMPGTLYRNVPGAAWTVVGSHNWLYNWRFNWPYNCQHIELIIFIKYFHLLLAASYSSVCSQLMHRWPVACSQLMRRWPVAIFWICVGFMPSFIPSTIDRLTDFIRLQSTQDCHQDIEHPYCYAAVIC